MDKSWAEFEGAEAGMNLLATMGATMHRGLLKEGMESHDASIVVGVFLAEYLEKQGSSGD